MKKINKAILSIKSNNVRNILRGIINNDDPKVTKKALCRIKKISNEDDFKKAILVIRENPLFEKNGVTREFNKACPKGLEYNVIHNMEEIVERINLNKSKIILIIDKHISILNSLFLKDYEEALKYCYEIIDLHGVSCYLLRCLFYIDNRIGGGEERKSASNTIDEIFKKISIGNSRYIENVIREISSHNTDYFNIYKKITKSTNDSTSTIISKSLLNHIYKEDFEFKQILSSYYLYSIIDAYLYLMLTTRFSVKKESTLNILDKDLINKFHELSKILINLAPHSEGGSESESISGLNFFRECFLLIEQQDCYKYKTIHGAYYNENENKLIETTPAEKKLISNYFFEVSSICDIKNHNEKAININKFGNKNCNLLENSTALIYIIEKNDGDITGFDNDFITIMNHTRDIGSICPANYLQKINDSAENINLKVVLACLILVKEKTQLAEHSLRKVLQLHCKENFNSSIKGLISTLYEISPAVAEHLVQICDETFLTKLFQINKNPNKAVEDRAEILDWYGSKIGDNTFKERAKNLKIDVQISKEKGTIDDSRIYVDPLKFTQWINNNIINGLTILLSATCDEEEINSVSINWESVNSGLSNSEQISSILLECFNEFCLNSLFGIASYLGRRIRHGTFKGTGLKDLKELYTENRYKQLFEDKDFANHYDSWIMSYEDMLEELKSNRLHFKTKKKPNGLFNATLNTSIKKTIASQMYIEVYNSFVKSGYNVEIPYLITEYCWRLIEEDLLYIRKFIMEKKSNHAIFETGKLKNKTANIKLLRDFSQEINSNTTEKFRTITSWFNKPSIASPSTDLILLFKAVVSEVKGLSDGFLPSIKCGSNDFPVNGGQYFVIYDALYVLIFNAAAYGLKKGLIEFNIEIFKNEKYIKITVISEVKDENELNKSKGFIKEALSSDFINAHIIEGRSGIKKLKQMEKDKYIDNVCYRYIKPNKISSSFNYTVEF